MLMPRVFEVRDTHERLHIYDALKAFKLYNSLDFNTFNQCAGCMYVIKQSLHETQPIAAIGSRYAKAGDVMNINDLKYHCTKDDIINYIEFLQVFPKSTMSYISLMPSLIRANIVGRNDMFSVIERIDDLNTNCCCRTSMPDLLTTLGFKEVKSMDGVTKYYVKEPYVYK